MIRNDFRVGLRILVKDPAYSLVAVLGLGVGLAVCLLVLGFARYSWEYNSQVPDVAHVYIVKARKNVETGTPWYDQAPDLLRNVAAEVPGVSNSTGFVHWFPLTAQVNGQLSKLRSIAVLPGFIDLMGLRAISGDLAQAVSRPDSLALTRSTAIRLFGTPDALGRSLQLSTVVGAPMMARVAAILPDPPANTTIPFEALHGLKLSIVPRWMSTEALTGQFGFPANLLIRVHPDAALDSITEALQHAVDVAPGLQMVPPELKQRLGNRKVIDIKLAPLRAAYFDQEVATNVFSLKVDRGNPMVVAALVAIGLLILAIAAINYVNLATIRVIRRQREIAIRQVLGVSGYRLAVQFVAESLLVSMLATVSGLLLAYAALPAFAVLMSRDLHSLLSIENIGVALLIGSGVGLLTAIYPVWIALGVRPALMLGGRSGTESLRSKRLRQGLSVLQVAAAMGLGSFALAVYWQTQFAMNASPGFNPAPLLVFQLSEGIAVDGSQDRVHNLITALSQQPGIAGVTVTTEEVGQSEDHILSADLEREGDQSVPVDVKSVRNNFFEQYGIRPLVGRLFDSKIDREDADVPIVIDATAARALGFKSPQQAVGQTVLFRSAQAGAEPRARTPKLIVGIAPEVRFYSLRDRPHPMMYEVGADGVTVTVHASGSIATAERAVRTVWSRYFPDWVLVLSPVKDVYAANYADDARLAKLLGLLTLIAVLIAAFGVYVLASDAVQRRTKEIALRKLFGTRRRDIGKLVAKDVGAIILLSAVIAMPLAALAITRYLAVYAEQTPFAFWSMALALVAALLTAAAAAARQAWMAMTLKPVAALQA